MALAEVLQLIRLLGSLSEPIRSSAEVARKLTPAAAEVKVDEAARMLANWPQTLYEVVNNAGGAHATSDISLRARFGHAYERIKASATGRLAFVAAELQAYAALNLNAGRFQDRKAVEVLVPLHQARISLNLSYENARKLVRHGVLRVVKQRMGKFDRLLVYPSELAKAVQQTRLNTSFGSSMASNGALSRTHAAERLSIGKSNLSDIVEAGLLGKPVQIGFRKFVTEAEIASLLGRLEKLVIAEASSTEAHSDVITLSNFAKNGDRTLTDLLVAVLSRSVGVARVNTKARGISRYLFCRRALRALLG